MSTSFWCTKFEGAMLRCMPSQTRFLTYKPDCVFPWVSVLGTLSTHRKRAWSSTYRSYGRLRLKSSSSSVLMRACTLTCLCYQTLQLSSKQRFPFQMAQRMPGYQLSLSKPLMQYSIYCSAFNTYAKQQVQLASSRPLGHCSTHMSALFQWVSYKMTLTSFRLNAQFAAQMVLPCTLASQRPAAWRTACH